MKSPKPTAPVDAPAGTISIGGPIEWFDIRLSVRGSELIPAEITAIMGRSPSSEQEKDKPILRPGGTAKRIPKFGAWWAELKPEETDEWDCGEAMHELFATMPQDPSIWHDLASRYKLSLDFGLQLRGVSQGFELSPESMVYLGERKISARFHIYDDDEGS